MGLDHLALRIATQRRIVSLVERFVRKDALSQGPPARLEVALTFDDGPHPEWTPKVLDVLARAAVKATFFVVGRRVAEHRDVVMETSRRGHEIGMHLYSHERGVVKDDGRFEEELRRSAGELEALLGEPVRWLRFPYGERGRQRPRDIFRAHGVRTAHWTFSALDGTLRDPADVAARVRAGLRPGAIVLLHDALADEHALPPPYVRERDATVAALPLIFDTLRARGLKAVTMSELTRLSS